MSKTVTLTLTEEHAQTVQDACEMLMRMKLGQTRFPTELMLGWPYNLDKYDVNEFCLRHEIAETVLRAFLRTVGNPEGTPKDDVEHMAYEVYGTIRHALYLANGGDKDGWSTAAQKPLNESGLDMPKCEVRDDEEG